MFYSLLFVVFIAGLLLGAFLFLDSKPRPLLTIRNTQNRLSASEVAGLLGSVVVQKMPWLLPKVIFETDKTIVFEHPRPKHKIHYMFVPKRDIKNIGVLCEQDMEYIVDLFTTMCTQINTLKLEDYRVWTNGPGKQDVAYLHFHLGAQ